ncbi:DEAD-box helicase Dbp80 [Penaeus vannamei]|uniref:RNA helicase n=1 Tax=Penaeus vannamei TaxID=6689 RepID=A0A3R7QHV0_PENVA|nr:DEAD-box helicase Dbp80-like [Penaeus vannamei]ROT67956.1 DEAD-box helicase Dbp80 [Penaeus vannamei]
MSDDWAKAAEEQEAKDLASKVQTLSIPEDASNAKPAAATEAAEETPSEASTEEALTAAEESLMRKVMRKGIIESKNNVEVYRKDPNNPLYSVKDFEALNLRKELLDGIYDMGFKLPSKIQETALPTLLADPPVNMIAQSQSGTGKTAAFSLAMLSRIDPKKRCTQALCLSPTLELALQTLESITKMGMKCTDISIRAAVKGETVARGQSVNEHIVVGTPGKVLDWVKKYKCLDLSQCRVFVLDEADVMIATQGHQDQSVRIHKHLPSSCQMMLFSATYEDQVVEFAEAIIPNPVIIRLHRNEETLENIRQMYVECKNEEEKYLAISNIYTIPVGNSMFFCHTKRSASSLASRLKQDGHQVALLTGDLTPDERVRVLTRYREGQERVLICTNVLARGIDVESVNLVVNYDLPVKPGSREADCETYLHRIGRTGRFGKTGNAINIVEGRSDILILKEIESHFNIKIAKLDYNNVEEIEKLGED